MPTGSSVSKIHSCPLMRPSNRLEVVSGFSSKSIFFALSQSGFFVSQWLKKRQDAHLPPCLCCEWRLKSSLNSEIMASLDILSLVRRVSSSSSTQFSRQSLRSSVAFKGCTANCVRQILNTFARKSTISEYTRAVLVHNLRECGMTDPLSKNMASSGGRAAAISECIFRIDSGRSSINYIT